MNTSGSYQRIVVGIDGSLGAARAATWAARLAVRREMELHLLHAVNVTGAMSLLTRLPYEEFRQHQIKQAEALLDEVRTELLGRFPSLSISTEIFVAEAAEALVAATGPAALTVIGTRGRGGFPGLGLGSVGLRLAAHSRGPIVVVPAEGVPGGEPAVERNEVVLGVAVNESTEVVDFAFEVAEERGAALRAIHAWQPIPPYNGYYYVEPSILATAAEDLLTAAIAPAQRTHTAIYAAADAVCATPAAALIEAGQGAQALVLGAHRRRMPLSIGIGPVLHAVLTHAPCPVIVVPLTARDRRS